MGVHGLWKLIEPTGKQVPLENLENKVLAVGILFMTQIHDFFSILSFTLNHFLPLSFGIPKFTPTCAI